MLVAVAIELYAPAVLAFPYRATVGHTVIYAERPIEPGIYPVLARADRLLRASPLNVPDVPRRIVLTVVFFIVVSLIIPLVDLINNLM